MHVQATSAKLMWNARGTAVLALTASEVDATNQSYYGEQKLSFLAADSRNDCLVPLKVHSHFIFIALLVAEIWHPAHPELWVANPRWRGLDGPVHDVRCTQNPDPQNPDALDARRTARCTTCSGTRPGSSS